MWTKFMWLWLQVVYSLALTKDFQTCTVFENKQKTRATSYVNIPVASIGITENGQKKVDRQVPFMHYSLAFRQVLSGKWTMFFGCPFLGAKTYPRLDRVFPFFSSDLLS